MATIQDIADEVGISKAAVSRILNRKGSFNAATIEKVFQTARYMDYKLPSDYKKIEEQDFKIIAAVFPLVDNPYYSILTSLLEQAAHSYGYSLMISSSLFDKEKEEEFIARLREKKINGIIYGSFTAGVSITQEEELPIVTVGHKLSDSLPVVRSDNYSAGILAARHLIGKGCKKILYISGYQVSRSQDDRYNGFNDELKKSDIEVWPYFTGINERMKDVPGVISRMLIEHPDADAIFAESNSLAVQCMRVCGNLGIQVPDQLKIIGYGNSYLSNYSYPDITFIKENTQLIAQQAVATLVDMIENNQQENEVNENEFIIPVSLEQRQTT